MKKTFSSLFQLRVIFIAITIFLVVLSFFVFKQVEYLVNSSHSVSHTKEVSLELERLIGCLKDAETEHRGYLLTHDSAFFETFHRSLQEYPAHLTKVRQLTMDNAAQQKNLDEIERTSQDRKLFMLKILEIDKVRKPTAAEMMFGKSIMDNLRAQVSVMTDIEEKLLHEHNRLFKIQSVLTPVFLLTISLGALGILLYSYNKLNIMYVRSVQMQQNQKLLVQEAPAFICTMRGPDHIFELVNEQYKKIIGGRDVVGKPIREALPELAGQGFYEILDEVYKTGNTYTGNEVLVKIRRGNATLDENYINFVCRASTNKKGVIDGILIYGSDVTDQLLARKKIEESEEQLRIAVEGGELGTFDFDPTTKKLKWSAKAKELFGLPPDAEVDYDTYLKGVHPENREKSNAVLQDFFSDQNKSMYELEYRTIGLTDRKIRWVRSKGKATFDALGKPLRIAGIIQDVTQRKLAEEKIRESEARFRLLAEALPQLVWVTDEKGTNEYTSQRWEDYSGVKPGGLEEWIAIVHPDDLDAINTAWANSLSKGEIYRHDVRLKSKTGEYRWFTINGNPVLGEENKIIKWIGALTDVHTEKEFSQQLESQVQQRTRELAIKNIELEKMNKELESFTYISSHDLQEPLRKIQTFSTRILEKESETLSEMGKDYLKRVQGAAGRMQRLIEDLLNFSRTSTGERKFEKTNLTTIVEEVQIELKDSIAEKAAIIEVGELCEVNIIPFQFRQLLHNLIGNSLKFSKVHIPPHIVIDSEKILLSEAIKKNQILHNFSRTLASNAKQYCHISVKDNGIGFEQQYGERIFEVFQRLHGKNEYRGTGIGLAIVKKIVENHFGFITTTSEVDKGATFDIYIPMA